MSGPKRARKPKRAKSSNCLHFDGTNDTVVISDYDVSASGTGDFSISVWFKTDNTSHQKSTPFMTKEESRFLIWQFWINSLGKVQFTARDSSGFILNYLSDSIVGTSDAGEWNHVVYVCDRDAGQTVYINGSALTEQTDAISDTTTSVNNTGDVTLGITGSTYLDGKIAEYAAFSKALSASEVSFLYRKKGKYNLSRSKFGSDLTCWLRMGDGTEAASGSTVYDMSTNSNNGTISGAAYATDSPS